MLLGRQFEVITAKTADVYKHDQVSPRNLILILKYKSASLVEKYFDR